MQASRQESAEGKDQRKVDNVIMSAVMEVKCVCASSTVQQQLQQYQ